MSSSARGPAASRRFRAYLGLLALAGASRLLELAYSRRNERRSGAPLGVAAPGAFPAMVATHLLLFLLPPCEIVCARRPPRRGRGLLALAALAAATGLRLWSIGSLGDHWNVRGAVPIAGRVITHGPYRFVRHPNYVAVSVEMLALPLVWPAPLSAAVLSLLNAAVLVPRIRAEERLLARLPGYAPAMASKKRFIPGIV